MRQMTESQMADLSEDAVRPLERARFAQVAELLGGQQTLRALPRNPLEAHEMLVRGIPGKALAHLVENFIVLNWDAALASAVGMSLRTYQRHVSARTKFLSQEQSGRTWKLAEILAKATEVFGSRQEAEQWLERPAIGLNQRRPIDLLATPAGVELVETFLDRLDYGVYT
jgi:putative toxin-antitoxin system antitoxin component (TIGR02293 family)